MAYLLINNEENILINKVGESIYFRTYPQKYSQKSSILGKSNQHEYCASIDDNRNIHLVYKTAQNVILHLSGKENNFSATTILDDYENNYSISNLQIVSQAKSYLFYSAINPYEHTSDLIFHNFTDSINSAPQSLLALPNLNSKYQCFIEGNFIRLICCILNENNYELNLYTFDLTINEWENYDTLVASEYPITDFCFAECKEGIHVTYVIEKFGHSTLYYGQMKQDHLISLEILALGQKIKPILFLYNDVIWINYLTSLTLYSTFSTNGGRSFSEPNRCTLQNNSIIDITLLGCKNPNLSGHSFLGYIDHQPNIAVLSQIDVDHILFYSSTNVELREMLKGSVSTPTPLPTPETNDQLEKLQQEVLHLRELQKSITNQYNELANFTKDVQYEGKKWRKKYQRLTREVKEVKTRESHDKIARRELPNALNNSLSDPMSPESTTPDSMLSDIE